ncbi:hypothetical protein [Parendozoicomonas sp. Alg238-R29]|uniref:hypothetical protein n=1 Tax=Parendozoicomonas sp. Alg238-R29 TaxID=2993446 RepID=UPI00248D9E5D|nr:hypothetical protein [Parendozoicomonas sp. Alg238-R29]
MKPTEGNGAVQPPEPPPLPSPLTEEEKKQGITNIFDRKRSCNAKLAPSAAVSHPSGRDVSTKEGVDSHLNRLAESDSGDHSLTESHPLQRSRSESEDSVSSGYSGSHGSVEFEPPSLEERTVETVDGFDPTVTKMTDEGVNLEQRRKTLQVRENIIQGIRKDKAELWMHENVNKMLRWIGDEGFAEEEEVKVILVVGGKSVQIVPPLLGQGVSDEKIKLYTDYVYSSVANARKDLKPVKELKQRVKTSEKQLEKVNKKLTKEYGMAINGKAEKKWIQNTRILLILENGTGRVEGGRQRSSYIPEEATHQKQPHHLKPDALVVHTDADSFGELPDPTGQRKPRYADKYLNRDDSDPGYSDNNESVYPHSLSSLSESAGKKWMLNRFQASSSLSSSEEDSNWSDDEEPPFHQNPHRRLSSVDESLASSTATGNTVVTNQDYHDVDDASSTSTLRHDSDHDADSEMGDDDDITDP